MSKNESDHSEEMVPEETTAQYGEAFDRSADPLAKYSDDLYDVPDPFEFFIISVLQQRKTIDSEDTIDRYRITYRQWREHMSSFDRHPAAPNVAFVRSYIKKYRDEKENVPRTISQKLNHLSQAYEYWQDRNVLPHPEGWNPFHLGEETVELGESPDKEYPELSLEELRRKFASIEEILRRAVVGSQLKLGIRAGETANVRLEDIHLSNQDLQDCYPQLGTNPALGDYTDLIYIPHDREGNKSTNPRLIPIDEELQRLLTRYLLIRPSVDEPWLFLSRRTFTKMDAQGVSDEWREAFHPEYAETDEHKAIVSHFGRHWFSTHFRLNASMKREHVQYMRGDRIAPLGQFSDTIDEYLHPNYEHVRDEYRNWVFKLDLPREYGGD